MRTAPARFRPNGQRQPFPEVRNVASSLDSRGWKLALRFAHSAQRPLYPWTFLLDEWLNFPKREVARHHDLDAVRIDQDSRM
jgi:hypothetical protein